MDKIVIIGGGGHAKVLISVLKKNDQFEIIGYTDKVDNGAILGIKYLGTDDVLQPLINENPKCSAALGIGNISVGNFREKIAEKLKFYGYDFPAIISKNSVVNEDVEIGKGSVVFDGAVVNSGTRIGEFSIINSNSTVEHDCKVGDFVHIAPGVTVSGGVKIGHNSMLGLGANVIQNKTICENCMIGAGALVAGDCLVPGTYLGIPARKR